MSLRLVVTDEAQRDLEQIADFIAADSPRRALSFVDEITGCCLALLEMPLGYPLSPLLPGAGIRRRSFRGYSIYYQVTADKLAIIHVLNDAMDHGAILNPDN